MTIHNLRRNPVSSTSHDWLQEASLTFAAGTFGGLINSLTVWLFGLLSVTALLGVKIAPALTPAWLYPRLVWGGLWGLLFLLPLARFIRKPLWIQGLVYSLAPSIVQLFLVFPVKDGKGLLGLSLGILTPVFVLLFNAVWGIATAFWLHLIHKRFSTT